MKKMLLLMGFIFLIGACEKSITLSSARKTLDRARNCEEVKKYAAAELRDAELAYDNAKVSKHPDDVYLAKRKADLAVARGKKRQIQENYDKLMAKEKAKDEKVAKLKAELLEKEKLLKEKEAEESKTKDELAAAMSGIGEVKKDDRGLVLYISDILFDFGKADLKPGTVDSLIKIATVLNAHPRYNIRVEGHTDSVGSATYNQKLSQRRAKKVADFFVERGIENERVTHIGYGESKPLVSNKTPEGRQRNRRVEIIVAE